MELQVTNTAIDKNGNVVAIRSTKDGRTISKYNINGRINANYSKIEADALGVDSVYQEKIQKEKAISEFIPSNEFFDMPTLFNILIEKEKKILSFPIHEYWLDIGRIGDFEQAQSEYFRIFNE